MALLQKILSRFSGLHYRQEYLCFTKESFQQSLYVYLVDAKKVLYDVTQLHCFVGYCPLIFAFPAGLDNNPFSEGLELLFTPVPLQQNESFRKKDAIARLVLKKIIQPDFYEDSLVFYEGVKGNHQFISAFYQSIIYLNNYLYGRKPGNVFLPGNLYKQVQIGYALPRKICLITVGENNLYNLFPTDLHGQINEEYYVISLRHEGRACKQVEAAQTIVLSEMDAKAYKNVYALGKNHMQPLKDRSRFGFSSMNSKNFLLPLPENAVAYKELQAVGSFNRGIHKLILFRILHFETLRQDPATLAHIHNSYATWRNNQGFQGNYLLR